MKKKNIIISSFVTIALCLNLLIGSTFALFTSESKVNIAVTSGKVSVVANVDETSVQTKKLYDTDYTQGTNNTYEGVVTFNQDGLTLEKFVPGDGIKFNIIVKNESNVTVKYRTIISCENDNGLFAGLLVNIADKQSYNGKEHASKWELMSVGAQDIIVPVTIELPESAGNTYQEKTCTISYKVEAVQGNAETFNEIKASSAEEFIAALVNASAGDKIDATGVEATIENNQHFDITATDVTIKGVTFTNTSRGGDYIKLIGDKGGKIVFEECTFARYETGMLIIGANANASDMVFNKCVFEGPVAPNFVEKADGTAQFNECTFKLGYAFMKQGYVNCMGGTHIFTGCTFDYTAGSTSGSNQYVRWNAVNSYSEPAYATSVTLVGCKFTNCGTQKYGSNSTLTVK